MKNLILIILLSFLVARFAFGQDCPPLDNINPESLCTASDGTDGVLIFGDCYSIENTTEISFDIFGGTMATEWVGWQAGDTIPREIGLLTNLTHLKMRGILRTTDYRYGNVIPEEICHLTNLEELDLSDNALGCHRYIWNTANGSYQFDNCNETCEESGDCRAVIPSQIGYLTNLKKLSLGDNHLSGEIPSTIGNLVNLRSLGLSENDITGSIPSEIGNLTLLHVLGLSMNQLTGSIPSTIGNMTNLGVWNGTWYNPSSGGPDGQGMDYWPALDLSHNFLSGSIPPEIGNLTDIEQVALWHNQLSGPIPPEMGNMTSLMILDLRYNSLSGLIPPELENLSNMNSLWLGNNNLRGPIPEELCNIELCGSECNSSQNVFSGNNFCPPYPECFDSWPAQFSPTGNIIFSQLCNPYPDCPNGYIPIANTPPINYYSCQLSSYHGVPDWTYTHFNEYDGYCFSQEDLDVLQDFIDVNESFNGLEPLELGAQRWYGGPYGIGRLSHLSFSDKENVISDYNQHTGNNVITSIPESISNFDYLWQVNFSNTQITSMPTSIADLPELRYLDWDDGQLTGSIPPELGNMNNLKRLRLQNNQLTGSIPPELGNSNLSILWLKKNQLTGEVPYEIWAMTPVSESGTPQDLRLSLRENELTGVIPENVCDLDLNWNSYAYIDIRNNQFCPPYPSCLENKMGQQDDSNCSQASIIEDIMPITYHLYSAYPNPFNPTTTLDYDLPKDALVNITIYDMMGRVVKTMVNSQQNAGFKSVSWDATNDAGSPVSAGLYLYTIQAGDFRQTKKMVLLK